MTGVDTNIVVRLLTGDDPSQSAKARALFKKETVLVPETVILETEWVLRHAYGFESAAIHTAFSKLFGLPNVVLHNPQRIMTALDWYGGGMDFADALHLAASQDCRVFYSFDRKLAAGAINKSICRVKEP